MLAFLGERFDVSIAPQTFHAAIGLHGAGRFRAQCGLVEGALIFIGILGTERGLSEKEIETLCRRFAETFTETFGSLLCRDLRPGGFRPSDPPHACESITVKAAGLAEEFMNQHLAQKTNYF